MRLFFLVLLFFISSCAPKKEYEAPKTYPKAPRSPLVIVLDPGHGGESLGTKRNKAPQLVEKVLTLKCAEKVRECLQQWGYTVRMTRTTDIDVPLKKRVSLAKQFKGSLFVSIHFNHAANPKAHGIEVYYYSKHKAPLVARSKELATLLLKKSVQATKATSRGVREGDFCVIRENSSMPAVLIEGGFFSNIHEAKKLASHKYLNSLAHSIALGIDEFLSK